MISPFVYTFISSFSASAGIEFQINNIGSQFTAYVNSENSVIE